MRFAEFLRMNSKFTGFTAGVPSDMMKEMIDAGADFITTDEPELLQQVIREHCK